MNVLFRPKADVLERRLSARSGQSSWLELKRNELVEWLCATFSKLLLFVDVTCTNAESIDVFPNEAI